MKKLKSQILVWMFVIVIPLFAILISYNLYTLQILNKRVASNNWNTLSIYERPVTKDMEYIRYSMANMLANDANMQQLNYATGYLEAYICCNEIASSYRGLVNSKLAGLSALGISSPRNGIAKMVYAQADDYTYEEKMGLEAEVAVLLQDEECHKKGWQLIQIGDRNYLLCILKRNFNDAIIVLDLSRIFMPQDENDETLDGYMLYAQENGQPLTMNDFLEENHILLKEVSGDYDIAKGENRRFMVVWKKFPYAGITQYYVSPYQGVFQYLDFVQILLLAITVLIAGMVPFGFYYMKRTLFNPLETLTATMKLITDGQTDARLYVNYNIEEFIQMKDSFNAMLDRIHTLKIHAYERELQLKNVQLQYLQIQIRPHFFLNCLKNIYAMAAQKEYQQIEEMILALSQYLRSMFKSNPTFVPLREEMEGVENYIALQHMCQSRPPECRIDIDQELLEMQIPPLSIITFLENAVKHGEQKDKTLMLSIRVTKLMDENASFMCITILDNGPGFRQEILEFSKEEQNTDMKEHIGIINVKKRFEMLYHGKGTILFSNSNGACVELYIPMV